MIADDYFAGGGGWDVACELLGIHVTGYEILDEARRTRSAAGLKTSETIDVRDVTTTPGSVDLQIGSPPCQSFSMAGKGVGRRALDAVLQVVASYRDGHPMTYAEAAALMGDERTALVVEPLRLALEGRPMFIAWEQVPTVLPVWEACADVLRRNGYSVVTGCLNAEQYGVPQTRKRAILIARRDGREAYMPAPTHSLYYGRTPERLDEGVHKWVSMAEALGWGMTSRPYPVIASGRTTGGPDALKVGGSLARQIIYDEYESGRWVPAPGAGALVGMTTMPNSTVRSGDEPAPTIAFGHDANSSRWYPVRPATTALGDPGRDQPTQGHAKSIRISVAEAAVLQSFPYDFPWQGSLTKQFLQIGNAIPPLLAYRILGTFLDRGPRYADPVADFFAPEQLSLFEVE